jgi:hypothetical protein
LVLPGDVARLNAALDRLMGDAALRRNLPLWQWRSAFSAGLHADGLSLWQREVLCNELRWFVYNPSGS